MSISNLLRNKILLFTVALLSLAMACKKEQKQKVLSKSLIDKVYPLLDTENSRWFFFSSASRPFGMVNLSPDTQIGGAWGSGYRYTTDTIKGFSHIHAWQMSGVSVMPIGVPKSSPSNLFVDYYSKFSHDKEVVKPGYHQLSLDRYGISVELTSTKRVGFHKYTFKEDQQPAILFNLNTILGPCENIMGQLQQLDKNVLKGQIVMASTHRRPKPLTVYFKVELNRDIDNVEKDKATGNYLVRLETLKDPVLMKLAISYTSYENATKNMSSELTDWDFEKTVKASQQEWNDLLSRILIEGGSEQSQSRFYTDLWHALQGRRIISDVNGAYPDNTKEEFKIGQLPLDEHGIPKFNHYNSDAFWGAQWTINTLWGLVYPEIMHDFTQSLMQYYKDGGLVARGPSGGNYTFVMTGASSTPFIVSAIQKEIVTEFLDTIYNALKKNHMLGGIMGKAGYEHKTSIGGGLNYYIKNGFVPYPIPEGKFGGHQDGASQTLEYAYQDWTLAQLAKKIEKQDDFVYFTERSNNYKNVFDSVVGWMRAKNLKGHWYEDFDPFQYEHGFIESNAAQFTWFVPHDLLGLAELMGGKEKAVQKLVKQFQTAEELKFTSGTSHDSELHPEYSRIPINYGNQPSIQTAFVFNKLGRPDLTQYWSRKVIEKAFSGLSPNTGYNGDEDQGLMGSLNVLMKIGLFQLNGGTEENPEYQIGSPIFDRVTIQLNPKYYQSKPFIIEAENNDADHVFVKHLFFNDRKLSEFKLSHEQITKGGTLRLTMEGN
ncbi:glycoside hydrolase family 92 protein [Aestuariibaculum sp. TT11]|uniref:Glycoside hydrolase family 92 protein n=1 Tax=Aestuariibaculum sediminum TaxID=2770637 RepID=A0A8J6Q6Y7_9FLAO|nr:GH92 family glycosyl hydrolase [Aestuariibaculum sediminum]MBD0832203.1 glycoside hydrolase family 92 protein [Aestuariibaculum sediminum]